MDLEDRFLFQCNRMPSQCYARFKDMKQQEQLCDITIKFGNHSIFAHRLILSAAIPYFSDMFANEGSGSDLKEINLKEIDSCALESLIDFAYSCQVDITVGNVHSLLRASCSLNVQEVRDACCDFIGKRLNSENVLFNRKMAEELSCSILVETAEAFLCENFDEIAKTDEFLRMPSGFVMKLLARDDLRTVSEENVFQAVMKWIKASPDERKNKLPELLRRVRLTLLTPEYLIRHVHKEEYIQSSIPCRDLLDKVKFHHLVPYMTTELGDLETKARACPERKAKKSRGGIDGIYTVRKCLEIQHFDPENEKWEVIASSPVHHFFTVIGNPENMIFVDAEGVWWCSLQDYKWKMASAFMGRIGCGAVVLDNYVYVCGGADTCVVNKVERYNLLSNTSQKGTSMLESRSHLALVTLGGYVYALGGHNGRKTLDSVEKFDPKTSKWKYLSSMGSKRYGLSCTTMNNKIYVCGGKSSFQGTVLSLVEVYDSFTNQWSYISSMKSSRYRCSFVTYCGRLYALGGYDGNFVYLCSAEVYDPKNNEWKIGPSMDCSREHAKAVRFPSMSN